MKPVSVSGQAAAGGISAYMSRVYLWMMIGFGLTSAVALYANTNPAIMRTLMGSPGIFYGLMAAQLICVIAFSAMQARLSAASSMALYLFYTALTGLTFAVIFQVYTKADITLAFAASAGSFCALSLYGYVTKKDLSAWRTFLFMGLVGLVIVSIASIFIRSLQGHATQMTLGAIGVLVFAGFTAYDTQKIKALYHAGYNNKKAAICGALRLYLDFINLFLSILRLVGGGRR